MAATDAAIGQIGNDIILCPFPLSQTLPSVIKIHYDDFTISPPKAMLSFNSDLRRSDSVDDRLELKLC